MTKIIFSSKVTGEITDLDVSVNGKAITPEISDGGYAIKFTGNIPARSILVVTYKLVGMNGTDFSIVYSCFADDNEKKDPGKKSPINGTIISGNTIQQSLKINI